MRPGQSNHNNNNNNKRMRGRNRKGPNPLTRSFESNGPDVKIRGTALHIAEKYVTLARDAQSSGDRVMAESYLQHAEHYFRVIAAAQAQNPLNSQQPFYRAEQEDEGLDEEDDRFSDRFGQTERMQQERNAQGGGFEGGVNPNEAQPPVNGGGERNNGYRQDRPERQDRGERQDRPERQSRDDRQERSGRSEYRQDRPLESGERQDRAEPRQERSEVRPEAVEARPERSEPRQEGSEPRPNRTERGPRPERQPRQNRDDRQNGDDRQERSQLPRFVTGQPVPQPEKAQPEIPAAVVETPVVAAEVPVAAVEIPSEAVAAPPVEEEFRPRRRRTTRARTRPADSADEAQPELGMALAPEPVAEE